MTKFKLLIVDDNYEFCDILRSYFEMCDEIVICDTAYNGIDALTMIDKYEPDVVVLDIIMPKMDGISVLEQLQAQKFSKMPCIIVESAIGLKSVTDQALALGASYYMIKPYRLEDLRHRIHMLLQTGGKPSSEHMIQESIKKIVIELGIPTNILGYSYIIEATEILIAAERPCSMTKHVYPSIARKNNTTANCVESFVRKTINKDYTRKSSALLRIMGNYDDGEKRPSNGRFLTMLAEKVKTANTYLDGNHNESRIL